MHVLRSWFARSEYETITFRHSGVVGFLTRVLDGVDLFPFWRARYIRR